MRVWQSSRDCLFFSWGVCACDFYVRQLQSNWTNSHYFIIILVVSPLMPCQGKNCPSYLSQTSATEELSVNYLDRYKLQACFDELWSIPRKIYQSVMSTSLFSMLAACICRCLVSTFLLPILYIELTLAFVFAIWWSDHHVHTLLPSAFLWG